MKSTKTYLAAAALFFSLATAAQEPEGVVIKEPIKASVVVADPPLVQTVGDTVVFRPDALILEEDAVLEDILRKIPGMDVEGGVVTLYGRKVEKLLVEGRLYYGGDVLTGLRNIQGDSVESIKAYVRPNDFARAAGIDDGEDEPVLDVKIKRRFFGSWKGRVQGGSSWPLRYLAAGNIGMLTDSVNASALANFRNTPGVTTAGGLRPVKLGTGADGDRDRRDAGVDYSKNGKHLEIDANVKYTGNSYLQERVTKAQNFYRNSTSFIDLESPQSGSSDKVIAQADLEWKPTRAWTILVKPVLSWQGTESFSAPVTFTYRTAPWLDESAQAINKTEQNNNALSRRLDGKITFQATKRMAKKGRSASLRLFEGYSAGNNDSENHYLGTTFKNGHTTQRDYLIHAPWQRNECSVQGTWNEPLGRGFHLQLQVSGRWVRHNLNRDYFRPEDGAPDGEFTSDGSYQGFQLNTMAGLRYIRKKVNVTAGVVLRPIWSKVRYNTADVPGGTYSSRQFYAAPNLIVRYNRSKEQYLAFRYNSSVGMPSPGSLIPVRSGTNPLYINEGNPELKPSFTHKINLTYNHSAPAKGNSLVAEATVSLVQNAFSSATEYNPDTGGRIIRTRNIDGTWSATGSLVFNHSFKDFPLSLSSHTDGEFTERPSFLYNSATHADEISRWHRTALRERLDANIRWRRYSLTLTAGVEYSHERSLVFEDLDYRPYALFCQADAAVRLPYRWRISTVIGLYSTRGHGFEELDRDLCLWNASVSKAFLDGKLTLRLTANDILNQNVHFTYQSLSTTHRYGQYNGFGRMALLQLIWRFGGK